MPQSSGRLKRGGLLCFLCCLVLAFLLFLPYLVVDHGYFIYYGDFNAQQIPFYQLAHDAVRSGRFGWNWLTDLGANFIGSYSFYLLGSPFFWLTIPFPREALPYLMAPLLMLKFACCGLTSYVWLRTQVQQEETAVLGGVLYAFCGFNLFNIFFNHFLEPVILFPLLLWAMDACVLRQRGGCFALLVGCSVVTNYYFFFGQAVFLVFYYFVCVWSRRYRFSWKELLTLGAEAALGVGMAACLLVPSLLAILGNDRIDNFYLGMRMLFYSNEQRYGLIAESLFLLPDVPACANLFADSNAKWASVSLYVPLFTVTGAAVYFKNRPKSWVKRLLILCAICAAVPFLNSLFSALNANYYARWFYMPTLLLVLCTMVSLEEVSWDWHFGWKCAAAGVALLALFGCLPSDNGEGVSWGKLPTNPALFWETIALAVLSLFLVILLTTTKSRNAAWRRQCAAFAAVAVLLSGYVEIGNGRSYAPEDVYTRVVTQGLEAAPFVDDGAGEFYRVDFDNDVQDNTGMFWKLPTIQCFHSIVPASVMQFYQSIGVERDVASRPDESHLGLRALTSVRYRMVREGDATNDGMVGFAYQNTQNGFLVYENRAFLPMGFTYDRCATETLYQACPEERRELLLLKAIVLADEDLAQVRDLLPELSEAELPGDSAEEYLALCHDRRQETASSFTVTDSGFTAQTNLSRDNLVFFSVPYDKGWSATVNGEAAHIFRANRGFMAVQVPSGEADIVFTYRTPGLSAGMAVSAVAWLVFLALWVLRRRKKQS